MMPNHPSRENIVAVMAMNINRVVLLMEFEVSADEKIMAIRSAPKNAPIAAHTIPTSRRTVTWMMASFMFQVEGAEVEVEVMCGFEGICREFI